MKTLQSFVNGRWHEPTEGFVPLVNPATEEDLGRISSRGVDFAGAVEFARREGGSALRAMSFAERGALLKGMSKILRANRDELLDLSRLNNGTTQPDGSFDIDGAGGTLAYYAAISKGLGENRKLIDGSRIPALQGRGILGSPSLGASTRRGRPYQRLQFPGLGLRREGGVRPAGGHAGDHQARFRHGSGHPPMHRAHRGSRSLATGSATVDLRLDR